jgi:V8-like Glu-specific endopeptidase
MESFGKNYLKWGVKIIAMLAFFSLVAKPIYAEMSLSDFLKKSVIAIGIKDYNYNEITKENSVNILFRGAGVLVAYDRYTIVTAKHVVFNDDGEVFPNLCFWGNNKNGEPFLRSFSEIQNEFGNIKWVPHPDSDIDVAASIIYITPDGEEDLVFAGRNVFTKMEDIEIGSDVRYLGYPTTIGAIQESKPVIKSNPVLRRGMVAHKEKGNKFFHIDAVVASGNSGGPVFLHQPGKEVKLLGIVCAFPEFLTKDMRIHHSGLGVVFSADSIKELLDSPEFKKTY